MKQQKIKLLKQLLKQYKTQNKKLLKEKRIPDEIIRRIAHLTDMNDHNGSRAEASSLIFNSKLERCYKAIETLNMYFGNLSQELDSIRRKLDKHLYGQLKMKFDNADQLIEKL